MEVNTSDFRTILVSTTAKSPPGICASCTDSMITNGILGGLPFIAVLVLASVLAVGKKCHHVPGFVIKHYNQIVVILGFVGAGLNVSTVIPLLNSCRKIDHEKCAVGHGYIAMACFVFLDLLAFFGITLYLGCRKDYFEREKKVLKLNDIYGSIENLHTEIMNTDTYQKNDILEQKLTTMEDKKNDFKDAYTALHGESDQNEESETTSLYPNLQNVDQLIVEADTKIKRLKSVQNLLENITMAKQLWDASKEMFEEIKTEHLLEKAENKLRELERKKDRWDKSIETAVKLEKELQGSRPYAAEPLTPDALEKELQRIQPSTDFKYLQYLQDAQKPEHEHYIHRIINAASKEIRLKKEEISPGKLEHWIQSENTYYPTKATAKICEKIQTKKKVVASGLAGSGKTAAIHHTALKLKKEGYRLCCVETFNDIKIKMDRFGKKEKQVYVIDDVFGVHGVNESKSKQWGDDNKDEVEQCFNNPNISILCSSRIQVLNDTQLNTIKSRFTIVNISEGAIGLSKDERVGIFRNHAITKQRNNLLTENKDELKDDIKERVREVKCPVGCFPLVCHLYTGEEEPTQTIEEYFNKPLKVIADHLEKLKVEDPLSHLCLLLCLIYDNKLPVSIFTVTGERKETKNQRKELLKLYNLNKSTSQEKIREKIDTLLQTFVKREGDTYQFVHDIIHDAVIQHVTSLSWNFHQVIIRHCSPKFLLDRVHLSGVVCKDRYGRGHDTESCINIGSDSFPCWGDHVLDIVRDGVRTSDQLYNDIDEGKCSRRDDRTWWDNPWRDVFEYNGCVRSTEGQDAIAQALDRKSSDLQTTMCTKGYCLPLRDHPVTGLHYAMKKGLTRIVTQTVSMLSPPQLQEIDSIGGEGLLYLAIYGRCGTDVIKALIVGGADVNTPDVHGHTPLYWSVFHGDYKITQLLVDNGADANQCKDGQSVLYLSQCRGYDTITELLQSRGAVCMYEGKQYNHVTDIPDLTLLDFVEYMNYQAVKTLIERGADVNQCDELGRSALYGSVSLSDPTGLYARFSLNKGADGNQCDKDGTSVLYTYVSSMHSVYKMSKLLLDNGADVNKCDRDGTSVLCMSQLWEEDAITELLQSRGAVCMYEGKRYNHVTDIPDFTSLDCVQYNNYQAVKTLIERGADVNQCDEEGTSVLYMSQLWEEDTITELLQSHGAVCMYEGKTIQHYNGHTAL